MKLQTRTLIIACLWLAFFLRIWGLDFGLPYEFHPDEHQYVDAALRWYTTGEMETRFVNPPLFTYVLVIAFWFWFALTPFEPSPEFLTTIYFFARLWSAIFGMLTIALMSPLGKKLRGQKIGLLSVILVTGLFLPAREAHFAVNDTTVTFFVLLAIYFCLKVYRPGGLIYYLGAGAAIGLTTATKFTGALTLVTLIVTHGFALINRPDFSGKMVFSPKAHRSLWLGLLVAFVTFVVVSAQVIWQLPEFIKQMDTVAQLGVQGVRGVQLGPTTGWQFYVDVFGWGIGWAMFGVVLVVLSYVFFTRQSEGIILSIFSVVLFVFMGAQKLFTARYLLPAIPPLVVLTALGLAELQTHWLLWRRYQVVCWSLLVIMFLAQPLINLIWFDYLLTLPNTQQIATDWFIGNFPEDTVVVKETYSIFPDLVFLNNHWPYKITTLDPFGPTRDGEDYYVSHKTQIIALSNFRFARIREDPVVEEMRLKQLTFLDEKASLIKEFNPYRRADYADWFYQDELYGPASETLQRIYPGPLIKLYRLPYESQPFSFDVPPISIPIDANFDGKITLLGYDLPARRAEAGSTFPLTLYWQALVRMDKTYVVFNHLLDNQQRNWGGYDRWPQETAKTTLWHPGEIIVDTFNLPVNSDAPDGIYTIDIGLYDQSDPLAVPLPIVRREQPVGQNSVPIGPVKVGLAPPGTVLELDQAKPDVTLVVPLGQPYVILLRGYNLSQDGDSLQLTLYWESINQTPTDWSIFVHLRNRAGETVAQKDGPAGSGRYPTSLWDVGEIVADELIIPIEGLPDGHYNLFIGLYDLTTGARLAAPDNVSDEILLAEDFIPVGR
ncbi:MAG: glycosyltransferase family 39 protein [Anaerolineae bacterium]|nr:glycosyltransferase family 39 protein [Anaerolineae bacterium]